MRERDEAKAATEPPQRTISTETIFAVVLTLAFFAIVLVSVLRHEMWRDEFQQWLIAKDSTSLGELLHNARYERQDLLLDLYLFGLTRVTAAPVAMQLTHLIVATAIAFLIGRFAPFPRWQRALLIFGYFFAYEYAVIVRGYLLGVFLLISFCTLYSAQRSRRIAVGAILGLLALTNFLMALIAGLMLAVVWWEAVRDPAKRPKRGRERAGLVAGTALAITGLIVAAIYFVSVPEDYKSGGTTSDLMKSIRLTPSLERGRVGEAAAAVWRSYVPVPPPRLRSWNRNILRSLHHPVADRAQPALAFALVVGAATCLARGRSRLVVIGVYLTGTAAMIAAFYAGYPTQVRHYGHLYVLLVACLWLSARSWADENTSTTKPFVVRVSERLSGPFIGGLLAVQVLVGAFFTVVDWTHPFSMSKATARFIRQEKLDELPMVGDRDTIASAVGGYLDRAMYYPARDEVGTFVQWTRQRLAWHARPVEEKARGILAAAARLAEDTGQPVLLVMSYRLPDLPEHVQELGHLSGSVGPGEDYRLYLYR